MYIALQPLRPSLAANRAPFRRVLLAALLMLRVFLPVRANAHAEGQPGNSPSSQQPNQPQAGKDAKGDIKEAERLAERGDKALAAGKLNEALAAYGEAAKTAPGDIGIRRREASVRAQVVQKLVDQAEADALDGFLEVAVDLMHEAIRIDPGNTIVAERLAQMNQMHGEFLPPGDKEDFLLKGPPVLRPKPGKQSINVRGDSKSCYEQVARMFGITVAFDPDLTARNVKLRADTVDFRTAMELLGMQAQTFYRVVNSSLIFVAQDSIEKRKQYAQEVEQTFRLDNTVAPEDMTEMMRVIREITNSTRISMDTKEHSLTVRETADKVALAGEIIKELEAARRDVMLDIELLEVDRNYARTLGVTPPTSVQAIPLASSVITQLEQATDLSNLLTLISQVFTSQGITASPTQVFPVGGGKSTFLLTMPSASATFSNGLTLVKDGREILMRAEDGKPATFFVGERFPVTLSLLSTSLGSTVVGGAVSSTVFPETSFAVGANPVAVAAQDFNNDAAPDLAVVNQGDSSLTILLNQGNGNFAATSGSPIKLGSNEQSPSAIASNIFRVTNATTLVQPGDLVVTNSASDTVSVLLGSSNFDGTFTEAVGSPFPVGHNPSGVIIADFNGDGFLDFAVINEGDNTISVFEGDGQGNFAQFPQSPFALPTTQKGPTAIAAGIFDNSGKPEFAVLTPSTQNIGIFQATGDNTFNGTFAELSGSPVGVGSNPVSFAAGDLNADGFADLAIVNQSLNEITVLLNDGTGFFTAASGSPLATASTPEGITIANFLNNGLNGIAVADNGVGTLAVYANLGSGQFAPRIELTTPAGPMAVINAVLTDSGLPDAVVTSSSGSNNLVSVLLDPTSFVSGAGTGALQTPYPGSEYIDIGVKVKATPAVHENNEVTLQLEFEIRALAGTNVNGIPIITNRTVTQTVRVRDDEPSLIAGLLDREETRSLSGIPGFANLPGIGYSFGQRSTNLTDNELLIVVTPRRMSEHLRASHPRYVGRGGPAASSGSGPAPATAPQTPPAPEQTPPANPNPAPPRPPSPNPPPQR